MVAPRGAGYGLARVYVDGVLRTTVDLSAAAGDRRVVFALDFGGNSTHTIRIANLGTSGRPLVEHDATTSTA